jgi:alpha-N-acetylglucosamine transferase
VSTSVDGWRTLLTIDAYTVLRVCRSVQDPMGCWLDDDVIVTSRYTRFNYTPHIITLTNPKDAAKDPPATRVKRASYIDLEHKFLVVYIFEF